MSEREIVCEDLNLAIDDLRRDGFRLDVIYPADRPHGAELSKGDTRVRLTTDRDAPRPSGALPNFQPEFVLTRRGGDGGSGRAGMLYRDLIPKRLGGRYIASHITIPQGGPVADWVHYHHIAFQLIVVHSGWVRVVYEDQGGPFVMNAGDMVLQPPGIRHRVLESSPGLEVIEISAPALHETFADHEMELPGARQNPERNFEGQRFLRHVASKIGWMPFGEGESRDSDVSQATGGLAEARVIRPVGDTIRFSGHNGELVFGFVLDGSAQLEFQGVHQLNPADSFVIPPEEPWVLRAASPDFRLLHVTTSRLD